MKRSHRNIAAWRASLRHEFVLRPTRRPGSICGEVEANSVRMARAAREAERRWRRAGARS